jgi:hypothetical protein
MIELYVAAVQKARVSSDHLSIVFGFGSFSHFMFVSRS